MFTGIVEEVGRVRAVEPGRSATRLAFDAPAVAAGLAVGESVAVDGACLTVVDSGEGWWGADAVAETLGRTTLGRLRAGDAVNLERPVRAGSSLGGHLVQGHVDGVGKVVTPAPGLVVRAPEGLARYLVPKGSVTVDGCSLTVVESTGDTFSVALIPHTVAVTTLGRKTAGDAVNLEADVIAKYVERLLAAGAPSPYRAVG